MRGEKDSTRGIAGSFWFEVYFPKRAASVMAPAVISEQHPAAICAAVNRNTSVLNVQPTHGGCC